MSLEVITKRIIERSAHSRAIYLKRVHKALKEPKVTKMACSNLAHTVAACSAREKELFLKEKVKNVGIVSAYSDMLSAHAPFYRYPEMIKKECEKYNTIAQVAGGVPSMCDGVTQGEVGMELSLFSRDIIAGATAISLSHNVFDGAILLGMCDKIAPGLFMGLMSFGHLPAIFLPAGPMASGILNEEKARVRQEYAKGNVTKKELLKVETASYSAQGICTFYGTANTNQMLLEVMGLHIPSSSFVPALSQKREAMNSLGIKTLIGNITDKKPVGLMIDEKSFVNAIVMLLATGGSTNHTIHLIAMARSCGIVLKWQDFADLSRITPLLAKVYPNGSADINHFHQAGGVGFVINELLRHKLLHEDVDTVVGRGLSRYATEQKSKNVAVLREKKEAFAAQGGLVVLSGNIGQAVIKISSLKTKKRVFSLPAIVFTSQEEIKQKFTEGELNRDFIAVLCFQGPNALGMPELHSLSPILGSLQDDGYDVVLITDGRLSGASGKFPALIHTTPEASKEGVIGLICNEDIIEVDIEKETFSLCVAKEELDTREAKKVEFENFGSGRELFELYRKNVSSCDTGATQFSLIGDEKC